MGFLNIKLGVAFSIVSIIILIFIIAFKQNNNWIGLMSALTTISVIYTFISVMMYKKEEPLEMQFESNYDPDQPQYLK
jgi:Ca2+/Na+ antiporter